MAYSGRFKPKNPHKYRGDPTGIIFRSLWERTFMKFCDDNPSILEWNSEEIAIPYVSPVDGKYHRYFPDFWIKYKTKEGITKTDLIEIKPSSQCVPPKEPKRKTKKYLNEVKTFAVNQAKWESAKNVADIRGWGFKVITEKDLYKNGNSPRAI